MQDYNEKSKLRNSHSARDCWGEDLEEAWDAVSCA